MKKLMLLPLMLLAMVACKQEKTEQEKLLEALANSETANYYFNYSDSRNIECYMNVNVTFDSIKNTSNYAGDLRHIAIYRKLIAEAQENIDKGLSCGNMSFNTDKLSCEDYILECNERIKQLENSPFSINWCEQYYTPVNHVVILEQMFSGGEIQYIILHVNSDYEIITSYYEIEHPINKAPL